MGKIHTLIIPLAVLAYTAFAAEIYVPTDYLTIQAGIDATGPGDTVIVQPGRYYENITMGGKSITLRSLDPADPAIVTATIIDGNASGSVMTCNNGEDPNTIIKGFVITNGNALYGGGIYNDNASPTISDCTFTNNTATNCGGGMYNVVSSPLVLNCSFTNNTATNCGGGIHNHSSSPILIDCNFTGNTANQNGGGIVNASYSSSTIQNCKFIENTAAEACGGGMYNVDSSPIVTSCHFTGNTANATGGGIFNYRFSATITSCTFYCNIATNHNGGSIANKESSPTIINCEFVGNMAYHYGGGIFNYSSSIPTIISCTFSNNAANYGGGIASYNNPSPKLSDSYFCFNIPVSIYGNYSDNGGNNFDFCPPPVLFDSILFGDSDNDGDVDLVDFAAFAANWLVGVEN